MPKKAEQVSVTLKGKKANVDGLLLGMDSSFVQVQFDVVVKQGRGRPALHQRITRYIPTADVQSIDKVEPLAAPATESADTAPAPQKRRGRPPKAAAAAEEAPKKRGRPRKSETTEEAPKKRGRPKKNKDAEADEAPKKRGRPKKNKDAEADEAPPAKKRGRPKKDKDVEAETEEAPKKRGRPKKDKKAKKSKKDKKKSKKSSQLKLHAMEDDDDLDFASADTDDGSDSWEVE